MKQTSPTNKYLISSDPYDPNLSRTILGYDQSGMTKEIKVVEEQPLTIFLNSQEVITAMSIGDHPKFLAIGFLCNQNMLRKSDHVTSVDYDKDLNVVVVRTSAVTNFEKKMSKKIKTSGCAMGTIFGDIMDTIDTISLPKLKVKTSDLYSLVSQINQTPSLYLEAGAIHGTVLCKGKDPIAYMEDVGRHNAVDKVAGLMFCEEIGSDDKILYTTGRLTSEMVIKTAVMGVPVLISRSGFTAWGVQLAQKVGMTLIGRMRGKRFVCLSGIERLVYDE